MATRETLKKVRLAVMNAIHDLPVLVARDEGFFNDEGLDLEFVTTPGMSQVTTDHKILKDIVFERPLDSLYNECEIDQYRMCEWGVMKRAVEATDSELRPRKIVALGAAMSTFAIVVAGGSDFYEPEQLKDMPIAVTPYNGSNFTTLKMMEGFLQREHIETVNAGTMPERLEALRRGDVTAVNLSEPWISVAHKQGFRILIEAHSSRSEAASDDLDGPTLAAMFRAEARAADLLNQDPSPYIHYLVKETGGILEPKDLQTWRLLQAHPKPYTRQRFDDTYQWSVGWGLIIPGATYEAVVDNRAWE